jgi:hypothetical protein
MKCKFNHKKLLEYIGYSIAIGVTVFIIIALIAIIIHIIQHGAPSSFGIYG